MYMRSPSSSGGMNSEPSLVAGHKPMTRIMAMKYPPERDHGIIIEGDSAQAKAAALVKVLHEESKVI